MNLLEEPYRSWIEEGKRVNAEYLLVVLNPVNNQEFPVLLGEYEDPLERRWDYAMDRDAGNVEIINIQSYLTF